MKNLRVKECMECEEDNNLMYVGFGGGLGRLFKKENFMATIKSEEFYNELDEISKVVIGLGYACATGQLQLY